VIKAFGGGGEVFLQINKNLQQGQDLEERTENLGLFLIKEIIG